MLEIVVYGKARPKGNMARGYGKHGMYDAGGKNLELWMASIAQEGGRAMDDLDLAPFDFPVVVDVAFYFIRPKSHYLKSGALNTEGLRHPYPTAQQGIGDRDKLQRAIGDALEGIVWTNDKLIVGGEEWKLWGDRERVEITVWRAVIPEAPWSRQDDPMREEIAFGYRSERHEIGQLRMEGESAAA